MPDLSPRSLHFTSIDDILADAREITGHAHGPVAQWTPAQNIEHMAQMIHASVYGFGDITAPFPIRMVGRIMRISGLYKRPIPRGVKMPRSMQRSPVNPTPDLSVEVALQHLADAVDAAHDLGMSKPSPLFGTMTHEQWQTAHSRHAELHFANIAKLTHA